VEVLFLKRVQTILENQGIPEFSSAAPPWELHHGKGYESWKASELIRRLNETRTETISILSSLEDNDWTRAGSNEGSPVSLLDLGTWLTNHDVGHVAQIKRYIPNNA
jgi:DinB family protein